MLSSMYVQVAIAIDNEKLKRKLNRLKEKTVWPDASVSRSGEIVEYIAEIYEKCRLRRFEKTVLPLIMNTGKISGVVLDEFKACRNSISEMYFILTCFPWRAETGDIFVKRQIAVYTGLIEELVDEKEVFLLEQAKTVLSDENWFEMAEIIMEEDTVFWESDENRFGFQEKREWNCPGNYGSHIAETEYRI